MSWQMSVLRNRALGTEFVEHAGAHLSTPLERSVTRQRIFRKGEAENTLRQDRCALLACECGTQNLDNVEPAHIIMEGALISFSRVMIG